MVPLAVSYDSHEDVITIEGTRYAADLFRAFGAAGFRAGAVLRLDAHDGNTASVTSLREFEVAALPEGIDPIPCPFCHTKNCRWMRDVVEHGILGWHPASLTLAPFNAPAVGAHHLMANMGNELMVRLIYQDHGSAGHELRRRLIQASVEAHEAATLITAAPKTAE